jgi:hypothetical protein
MTKWKHQLLHHLWLLDKKYTFNECESVEKNCKKGIAKNKSDVGKHKANKKSESIQSHLEWQQKLQTKKECKENEETKVDGKNLKKKECEEMKMWKDNEELSSRCGNAD